jgi:hypothetical protein
VTVAAAARLLAATVATLDEPGWLNELRPLAGPEPGPPPVTGPTYHAVVDAGLALVAGLTAHDRWKDAEGQVELLADWCVRHRTALHPVAVVAFEGLHSAIRARDPDETADHLELLDELFPATVQP